MQIIVLWTNFSFRWGLRKSADLGKTFPSFLLCYKCVNFIFNLEKPIKVIDTPPPFIICSNNPEPNRVKQSIHGPEIRFQTAMKFLCVYMEFFISRLCELHMRKHFVHMHRDLNIRNSFIRMRNGFILIVKINKKILGLLFYVFLFVCLFFYLSIQHS